MYKIKNKIRQIRNLIRWIPILWRDRDWDYYFIYEILKQKLKHTEEYIREKGIHLYNNRDAESIRIAIDMIDKVQNEYYLDKYLSESKNWDREGIIKSMNDHKKAKKELFNYLNNNIEKWWD